MLVYGDAERDAPPHALLASVRDALAEASGTEGIERHGWLVAALIEAGEVAQGLADALFRERGEIDAPSPSDDAAQALVLAIARRVARSWRSSFGDAADPEDGVDRALAVLAASELPAAIRVRSPEGFAHYSVYPEAFLAAASGLPDDSPVRIIGLRSIGTTLAGMVAAGVPAATRTVTLRPVGHTFDRRIAASTDLVRTLVSDRTASFAIVDEGPGLSGSSVAAAVSLLEDNGVASDRIHLLPSHPGEPGPRAGEAVRSAWARCRRHVVTFDDLVLEARDPAHRLERWCENLVGPPLGPLVEISGGGWRAHRAGGCLIPVQASGERRKFLLTTASGTWSLRYAGLGRAGLRKLDLARRLHAAGFVPEPAGFRHGFLVERWMGNARPPDPEADRPRLLDRLGQYLAFRATLPAGPWRGASAAELLAIARRNAELGLGAAGAEALGRWTDELDRLDAARRLVAIDGRLQLWEWIVTADGTILKTDALDHHASHDLVGPQDTAWDIAGAIVELALCAPEIEALIDRVAYAAPVDRRLVAFLRPCYAAFQLGAWTLARDGSGPGADRDRLDREVARYGRCLTECPTPD